MRRVLHITLIALTVCEAITLHAQGDIDSRSRKLDATLLELPAIKNSDEILVYSGFVVNYNNDRLIPNWVAYELTANEVEGTIPRAKRFSMDLSYKKKQAMREDYSNSGWDKGHMAPAADMKWSQNAMNESFYLTNICPQNHNLNGRDWQDLEKRCRALAQMYGKVWIVCGPVIHTNKYGTIGPQNVTVPDAFFKAILIYDGRQYKSIAFIMDNIPDSQPLRKSAVTVNDLELLINYNLYVNLNDRIEEKVEGQLNLTDWNL